MALKTGLVAYFKLDETSGNRADSFGSNTLTDNNTVTSATGLFSTCASFASASSEYLSILDNAALSTGNIDFSIQAWVNLTTKVSNRVVVSKWGDSQNEYILYWDLPQDRWSFAVSSNLTASTVLTGTNGGSPSAGTWYHLIAWHDAANDQIGICVNNGTPNTAVYSSGITDGTHFFAIGRNGDTTFPQYLNGSIDEVGFWKKVLTASERGQLYRNGAGLAYEMWDVADATLPEVTAGPPFRGAPWLQRLPVEPSNIYLAPGSPALVGGDTSYAPEIVSGPAIRGAPWHYSLVTDGLMQPPNGGRAPVIVNPTGPGKGKQRPFFQRAPRPTEANYLRRMASITEKQMNLLNSLIRQGVLAQSSAEDWLLRPGGFSAARGPLASDDDTDGVQVGSTWVDTSAGEVYVCVDNTSGAAIWKKVS